MEDFDTSIFHCNTCGKNFAETDFYPYLKTQCILCKRKHSSSRSGGKGLSSNSSRVRGSGSDLNFTSQMLTEKIKILIQDNLSKKGLLTKLNEKGGEMNEILEAFRTGGSETGSNNLDEISLIEIIANNRTAILSLKSEVETKLQENETKLESLCETLKDDIHDTKETIIQSSNETLISVRELAKNSTNSINLIEEKQDKANAYVNYLISKNKDLESKLKILETSFLNETSKLSQKIKILELKLKDL